MRPSVTIEERYDNNAYSTSNAQADSDFFTTLSPQFNIGNNSDQFRFNALYSSSSRYYKTHSDLNNVSHNGTLDMGINRILSQTLSLTINDSISYVEDSLDTFDTGIQMGQLGNTSNNLSLTVSKLISYSSSANIKLNNAIGEYKNPAATDTRTDSASISLASALTENTTFTTDYNFSKYYFDTSGGENIKIHNLSLGVTERLTTTMSFSLSGGIVYRPKLNDHFDWTANTNISKTFEMTSINIGYVRSINHASGLINEIIIRDGISIGLSHTFSSSLNFTISAGMSKNSSEHSRNIDTKSYNAGISCGWQTYSWLRLGLGYSTIKLIAEGSIGSDVSRNNVLLSFTATPPEWRF